jgi:hypothetical protein
VTGKRKIMRRGNVTLFLGNDGWFRVHDGNKYVSESPTLSFVAPHFCNAISAKFSHLCTTESMIVGGGTPLCNKCFLGEITDQID